MDVTGGLFALGGVTLAAALAEARAWRESRARKSHELHASRREVYAAALRKVEVVASKVARWVGADENDRDNARREVWDALVSAYETQNEIRLIARYESTADNMNTVLSTYRKVLEANETEFPNAHEQRMAMVRAFRADLGIDSSHSRRKAQEG
jgi:hypothetical protein